MVTDGDVWVEPEWFRPLSVTLLTALLKCSFQNNTLIPKSLPCSCSLNDYLLLKSYPGFVSQSINAPIRKRSASKPISKRGSAIFFSATSSHALIFLFNPVTCYFLSSQQFSNWVQPDLCIDRNNKSIQIEYSPPLLIYRCFDTLWSWHQLRNSILPSRSQSAEGKLIQKDFLFMTLFESYCQPQEKEATHNLNTQRKRSCSPRRFCSTDPGNNRLTSSRSRLFCQSVLLYVFAVLCLRPYDSKCSQKQDQPL